MKPCLHCGKSVKYVSFKFCSSCARARSVFMEYGSGRYDAHRAMSILKRSGAFPDVRIFKCMDCDKPASCYDHRDYEYPDMADPVCNGCNVKRGHAAGKRWSFEEFWKYYISLKDSPAPAYRRLFKKPLMEIFAMRIPGVPPKRSSIAIYLPGDPTEKPKWADRIKRGLK